MCSGPIPSAIITITLAALAGWAFAGDSSAYFYQGGPIEWLSAGVTNFRGIYWEVERDTLIAIPLFVFMGIMMEKAGLMERLFTSIQLMMSRTRGALFIAGILLMVVNYVMTWSTRPAKYTSARSCADNRAATRCMA